MRRDRGAERRGIGGTEEDFYKYGECDVHLVIWCWLKLLYVIGCNLMINAGVAE